jgi:predicted DCC family thiol-disulfide oxidoreductase YuxK
MIDNLPSQIILFDGVCNLCNTAVQFIISHDSEGHFFFAALQSEAGQEILDKFNLSKTEFNSFIYVREGKVYQRSRAALSVLKDLGSWWKILYVFIVIPYPLRDLIYDMVAKYRYKIFGKRASCMIPTPDLQKKFLK